MAIRLVNLGDIHFSGPTDWASDKGGLVGRAIATSLENVEATAILVNGDLTYAGTKTQFHLAARFLSELLDAYSAAPDCPVFLLCTPGNHDCDFSADQSARDEVTEKDQALYTESVNR